MQRVTIDGFAALAWNDGAGLPVVYLHGFPDHPPTATPFLEALAARGHRVLAPWLRGYAPSPLGGPYDLDTLAADVCALVDRWSPDRPVALVGHDWGAAITYALCDAAPARIARAVTLALPHPLTFLRRLRRLDQLRRSWYMLAFQLPGAGRVAAARDLALVDHLWRTWSPGFALDPAARRELHACLAASWPAPLGYYRTLLRTRPRRVPPLAPPLLQLHGGRDGCVLPPGDADARRFAGPRVYEVVPDAGHFLHLEQPARLAERVAAWLAG
jgi:pimeloyl-ACP methyl ester carboxylesterase